MIEIISSRLICAKYIYIYIYIFKFNSFLKVVIVSGFDIILCIIQVNPLTHKVKLFDFGWRGSNLYIVLIVVLCVDFFLSWSAQHQAVELFFYLRFLLYHIKLNIWFVFLSLFCGNNIFFWSFWSCSVWFQLIF